MTATPVSTMKAVIVSVCSLLYPQQLTLSPTHIKDLTRYFLVKSEFQQLINDKQHLASHTVYLKKELLFYEGVQIHQLSKDMALRID